MISELNNAGLQNGYALGFLLMFQKNQTTDPSHQRLAACSPHNQTATGPQD